MYSSIVISHKETYGRHQSVAFFFSTSMSVVKDEHNPDTPQLEEISLSVTFREFLRQIYSATLFVEHGQQE